MMMGKNSNTNPHGSTSPSTTDGGQIGTTKPLDYKEKITVIVGLSVGCKAASALLGTRDSA